MKTQRLLFPSILLLACTFIIGENAYADTISVTYSFTGTAQNEVIANGFLTADGVALGSLNDMNGVVFETHNHINLATLQNYGTFKMVFPDGGTALGNLYENDVKVSLATLSGPFTQTLTFTGGTAEFANASGMLNGGGLIYPTYYTTSGVGTLTAPGLVDTPEPGSELLLLVGLATASLCFLKRHRNRRRSID